MSTAHTDAMIWTGSSRRYPSARDWWISLCLWGAIVLLVVSGWLVISHVGDSPVLPVFTLLLGLSVGLLLWILYGTWYELDHRELRARCGPFRMAVPYARIDSVVPCRNLRSGMALSVDRLAVNDREGRLVVLISPVERDTFLHDLAHYAPGLNYVDGVVERS